MYHRFAVLVIKFLMRIHARGAGSAQNWFPLDTALQEEAQQWMREFE